MGSGGARGIAHIVFLEVLEKMHIKPSIISGSSMGAVIGAIYASGTSTKELYDFLNNQKIQNYTQIRDISFFSKYGLIKGDVIKETVKSLLKVNTFNKLNTKLKVMATDFWNHAPVIIEKGEIIPALRASISVPGVFEPVLYNDRVLIDGGAVNPLPFDIIRNDCDILIAIDVSKSSLVSTKNKKPNLITNILTTFDIMQDHIISEKIKINAPEIYIKPDLGDIGILDFHKHKDIIKKAKESAVVFKEELTKILNA